ncbi:MAG: oligosaccharide flippase family protein [Armatimonadetes bacterium]|nr:oligosaccharide flippase family protein [Armatimonadota bacterium]
MPEEKSRSKGVMWLVGLRFIIIGLQIINLKVVVHYLGFEVYGIAVLIASVRALWQFVDLDIPQGLIQILSRTFRVDEAKAWRTFQAGLFLQAIVGLVGMAGMLLGPLYLGSNKDFRSHSELVALCALAGAQFFFDAYGSTYNSPFNAREQFSKVAALTAGVPVFTILLQTVLVMIFRSPVGVLIGTLTDSILQFVIKVTYIVRKEKDFPILPRYDRECCRDIIHMGLKSYVAGLSTRIAGIVDKIIVGYALGFDVVGVYNIACRIPQILLEAFGKITESVTPEMTHVASNEPHRLAGIFRRNFKFLGFVAAIGIIFISGFGNVILRAWMGRIEPGFGILVLLMGVYYGLELHHSTITRVFFAQGKPHLMLPFTLWNSFITLSCTWILAKKFGLVGVAGMNCFIDVAQILPIHYYCSRYGVREVSFGEMLRTTFMVLMPGLFFALVALLVTSQFQPGRWCFAVVVCLPLMCMVLAALYKRVGLVEFPIGVRKMLRRLPFMPQLFGIPRREEEAVAPI